MDWSDAEWIGDTIDAIGDFAGSAADFIWNAGAPIYDDTISFVEQAYDFKSDVGIFLFD